MDLLGDLGTQDQLTAARLELGLLQEKVKQLTGRVQVLTVENESLKAEVEMYREEAAAAAAVTSQYGQEDTKGTTNDTDKDDPPVSYSDLFVRAGQGGYPNQNEISFKNLHGSSNPLSVALSPDGTVLASGGADKALRLLFTGTDTETLQGSACLTLSGPVISVAFAAAAASTITTTTTTTNRGLKHVLACGCMDGSAYLVQYAVENEQGRSVLKIVHYVELSKKHNKYVKTVSWSPNNALLATSSADGTVYMYRIQQQDGLDSITLVAKYNAVLVESLHLQSAIEALTFTADNQLLCYSRNTAYVAAFDLGQDMVQTKINLNSAALNATAGGFDHHVSMAVMDLKVSASLHHACWLAATDKARNFVLDARSHKIVRNLYGHANDGYSQPKAAWSYNGQYVLGNTQDEPVVCVWDVASERLVEKLARHSAPVRDLESSPYANVVVTTSFDKTTRMWYPAGAQGS